MELYHFLPFTYTGGQKSSSAEHSIHDIVENNYATYNKGNMGSALFLTSRMHSIMYLIKDYSTIFANKEFIKMW